MKISMMKANVMEINKRKLYQLIDLNGDTVLTSNLKLDCQDRFKDGDKIFQYSLDCDHMWSLLGDMNKRKCINCGLEQTAVWNCR